jgi:transketolase
MDRVLDIPTAFGEALLEAGEKYPNIVVLDADLPDSCQTEAFYQRFPGRAFDLGVAEQSLPTFAAGLALTGKIPIYNTFAVFAVGRAFDQLRQSVAYNRANVKIVGHAAGLSLGYAGPSHHALEDVALMRALPNMVVLCPANDIETRQMVHWMVDYDGPVYLRLIRAKGPRVLPPDYQFEPGKTVRVRDGDDVTIFTSGDLLAMGLSVHERLAAEHLGITLVHVPTLKPLPPEEIIKHARHTRAAVTIEDHTIIGGLGDAVAKVFAEHLHQPLKQIGIRDTFTESDDRDVLLSAYGVSVDVVVEVIRELIRHDRDQR